MKLRIATAILLASLVMGCAAGPDIVGTVGPPKERAKTPTRTVDIETAEPPQGWTEFCARHAAECDVKPAVPRDIVLTSDTWSAMVGVNRWVNGHIRPTTDLELWGTVNKWHYPEGGRGDCKSFVLLKRRMLIEAGLPREALLIAIVWTKQDRGHAVLIARTDKGDFVLDNLSPEIMLAYDTGYSFVKRQSQFHPNAWVYIDGDPSKHPVAASPARSGRLASLQDG